MFLYCIYNLFTRIFSVFAKSWLQYRLIKMKEHPGHCFEKIGLYSEAFHMPVKQGAIWFHVASVGELNSIVSLVALLSKQHDILISSVTLNSFRVFEKAGFNERVHHVFAPFDTPKAVNRFLTTFSPKLGIFIDSELWPNLIIYAAGQMPLINLNARLSERSAKNWGYLAPLARYIYGKFRLVIPCSQDDYEKISQFVPQHKMRFIGNLKLTAGSIPVNAEVLDAAVQMFRGRFTIVLASTHANEEEVVIKAMLPWLNDHGDVVLIIAPRHPIRGEEIAHLVRELGVKCALRSKKQLMTPGERVYIADTIGEMGVWYTVSQLVIMGGSFVPVGGHNVLEPAKLDNALLIGPHYHNFREAVNLLLEHNAIDIVQPDAQLITAIDKLYTDVGTREKRASLAKDCAEGKEILHVAAEIINGFIQS